MRLTVSLALISALCIAKGIGQTIDQIIKDANKNAYGFDIVADERSETLRIEYDILMKLKDYVEMEREMNDVKSGRRKKRKAVKSVSSRWDNNVVPYEISSDISATNDLNEINAAIAEWNNYTCINFRPATGGDANRVRFIAGNSGCASYVGKTGDAVQEIFLANGCRFKRIVVHEMGHAIGFWHEQSRPDRDAYVRIITQNIQNNLAYNFEIRPESEVNNFSVPYDYNSVMHYSQYAFSTNGQPTIEAIDPAFQNTMGNAPGLSFRDLKLANLMYSCNAQCNPKLTCPGEGFQGKDCNCYCPTGSDTNPVAQCSAVTGSTSTTTSTAAATSTTTSASVSTTSVSASSTTTLPGNCLNSIRWCDFWAGRGLCSVFPGFMNQFCKKSCGQCSGVTETCLDYGRFCRFWQSRGYCQMTFVRYMERNCARTCGFCTPGQSGGNSAGGGAQAEPQNGGEEKKSSIAAILLGVVMSLFYIKH